MGEVYTHTHTCTCSTRTVHNLAISPQPILPMQIFVSRTFRARRARPRNSSRHSTEKPEVRQPACSGVKSPACKLTTTLAPRRRSACTHRLHMHMHGRPAAAAQSVQSYFHSRTVAAPDGRKISATNTRARVGARRDCAGLCVGRLVQLSMN